MSIEWKIENDNNLTKKMELKIWFLTLCLKKRNPLIEHSASSLGHLVKEPNWKCFLQEGFFGHILPANEKFQLYISNQFIWFYSRIQI